jgi:hypothetical protein
MTTGPPSRRGIEDASTKYGTWSLTHPLLAKSTYGPRVMSGFMNDEADHINDT